MWLFTQTYCWATRLSAKCRKSRGTLHDSGFSQLQCCNPSGFSCVNSQLDLSEGIVAEHGHNQLISTKSVSEHHMGTSGWYFLQHLNHTNPKFKFHCQFYTRPKYLSRLRQQNRMNLKSYSFVRACAEHCAHVVR
jgi:hypothetical protein